jgi:hypothetical protein
MLTIGTALFMTKDLTNLESLYLDNLLVPK